MARQSIGYWRSRSGQQAYATAYAAAMQALPPPDQTWDQPTDFGTVRAYYWRDPADSDRPPAVFVPGRTSGVPMWQDNLPAIAATRAVYAFDTLGDAGLSQQTAPIRDAADQARWIEQALAGLNIDTAHLVGHSFGGWLAANYASHYPARISSLALLEPVFTFQGLALGIYLRSIPAALPWLPARWRQRFLAHIGGASPDDLATPLGAMIDSGAAAFALKLPLPQRLAPAQLEHWAMPVLVALAERSAVHNSRKALAVAQRYVKQLEARLWPDATHSLPMERAAAINATLSDFMARHEAAQSDAGAAPRSGELDWFGLAGKQL